MDDDRTLAERVQAGAEAVERWQAMAPRWSRADTYTTRRPGWAEQFPLLSAHLATHAGYYPDAVKDTTSKRRKDGLNLKRYLAAFQVQAGQLVMLTIHLQDLDMLPLYSQELAQRAHSSMRARLAGAPGCWTIERGRDGGTHAHLIASAAVTAKIKGNASAALVDDTDGLAEYLSKPTDAGACAPRPGELARLSFDVLAAQKARAAEAYLAARAAFPPGTRLPKLTGYSRA
jgi:hypothetical protein